MLIDSHLLTRRFYGRNPSAHGVRQWISVSLQTSLDCSRSTLTIGHVRLGLCSQLINNKVCA